MPSQLEQIKALQSKVDWLEDRYKALLARMGTVQTALNPLILNGAAANQTLANLILPTPHQTTSNATISTTAGTFTSAERTTFNNLVNAVNNWQTNAQAANIEA